MQKFARMEDVGPSGSTDDGLQRGPWAEWEDELLAKYVAKYGEGNWASVKEKLDIGLKRCGKSCRLRYLNHLKPGLKKGAFSEDEEDLIFTLHAYYGNKWSRIALELPGRTDNEIKNFFHYKCKKLENAKLPVPGQSAADKARARAFVQSRLSAGEPSASLFPAERSSDSLLRKRGLEEAPEHEVKHQKTEAGRTGSGVPPGSQPGNSNITLRVPIIGPPKPLRFAHASLAEKAKPAPRLKRPMSSKNLESAGKLAQTAIDAARAAASIGVGPDDAALVAAASVHRNNLMDTKPSDSVAHMMTGVARLAAEAVLPRANSAGVDARGGQRFPMQMPLGFLQQQQRLELLAQLYSASERQGLKVQQQVAALFPASPVSILDVAQLEPQQRQLLEAQARAMLLARGGMLSRQASEPARLDALRLAAEIEAAGRMQAGESIPAAGGVQAAGTARPSQLTEDRLGELFERAAAFLRPKQEVGFEDEERSFDRREAAAQGGGRQSAWVQEVHQQEEEGQREDDANAVDEERKGKQGSATPLSHLERPEIEKKPGIVFGRGDEGSIGSEDVRSEGGSLLGPKMRAFKELRRPHLDILGQAEDPEPGPLTAAVGRHISPSESTAQTPRGWMWSPRLSAGRKKWAGPIWKTVNGHSVDISELSPDYVSELWGLDAETFACKTPTLSLFPGAISDEEAFSLSERGPSFTRSPSGSDGPWLPWPYDGKPVTRDEVSGKLVSPRTVMEAIESGPLSARTPRDSSDNELPSDGLGSRGSGLAPQWWLSMIGTPHDQAKIGTLRDQPQEDRQHGQEQDGGEREAGKGDGMAALEERDVEGPIRLEREEPAFREASLEVAEGKGDESEGRGGVVEGGKSWPSLKGKHRPSSSFSFSPLAPPLEGFATEEHGKEAGGPPAPETGPQPQQAGSSPKPASLLEQVCSLFSRPNGPPRNPE